MKTYVFFLNESIIEIWKASPLWADLVITIVMVVYEPAV